MSRVAIVRVADRLAALAAVLVVVGSGLRVAVVGLVAAQAALVVCLGLSRGR